MSDETPVRPPTRSRAALSVLLALSASALTVAGIAATADSNAHMYVAAACFAGAFAACVAGVALKGAARPQSSGFKLAAGGVLLVFLTALGVWAVFVHEPPGCEFSVTEDSFDPDVSWGRWEGRDCPDDSEPEMYIN